jgi:hypothetical protein
MLNGCAAPKRVLANARAYPIASPRGEVVDIQVVRSGPMITATNTTARSFGPSTLWINMRFGGRIESWNAGETKTLDLRTFRDEFGEAFRAGGFFASETPSDLVLAQLETAVQDEAGRQASGQAGQELLGLIVVRGKGNE